MNKIHKLVVIVCFGILETFVAMGIYATPVKAETRVGGLIPRDIVWSKEAGPYLLTDNVTVLNGATLTIESGVSVEVAPESLMEYASDGPAIFVSGGRLFADGVRDGHVIFKGISGVFVTNSLVNNGLADVEYADFTGGSRISFENSYGRIATSTISGTDMGIYFKDSIVSVQGSSISNNDIGVYVEAHQLFQVNGMREMGIGGIGNALDGFTDLSASTSLVITDSIIKDNFTRSINNISDVAVQAQGNWWGSAIGPVMVGANSIRGRAEFAPWLTKEPDFDADPTTVGVTCCSSVLFIPGLEGSRLYRTEINPSAPLLSGATVVNQLWEPMTNSDVVKLRLNPNGSSTDPSIYSGQPIDKALGFVDIYGGFMKSMDEIVKAGKINEWRAFGYDWRKPIDGVVTGQEKKATTTESLVDIVAKMASSSRTGKVSIVAHSNGGLVAKYLVKVLADTGRAALIDSVISVAVPYLGTPAAIPALLHGEGQSILGGIIARASNMRQMGLNMSSAYSLLPSREFFTKFFGPTIVYASTTADSFEKQSAFIANKNGNQSLMLAADIIHGLLDPFTWPATIARWAIVGWNDDKTTTGIEYSDGEYGLTKDPYGDGTVVASSASYEGGKIIPVDLKVQSSLDGQSINHVNILESSTTKSVVASIITNPAEDNAKVQGGLSKLSGVTVGDRDWNALRAAYIAEKKELRVSTHSPVKLHVYDSYGNHTGEVPLPMEVASQVEEGLYRFSETKIPGSTFEVNSCKGVDENDCDTYISLPDDGRMYTVVVEGTGVGIFRLDVERIRATSTIEKVEWGGVPVTPLTVATTTFMGDSRFVVPTNSIASSTTRLALDYDGDGTTDSSLKIGQVKDSGARLELIKKYISMFTNRHGHIRFRDLKLLDRAAIRVFIEAFLKKFGRI